MSTTQGCKFCIRHGLPIIPIRPAVVAKEDSLPPLPTNIAAPAPAKGETAWTGRLLREGFLYIWAESGKRWINYFATSDGYYYPLPESGDVPPDIANGKVKPCITQTSELAAASLITLPVKPLGMGNGLFWFTWSGVAWTPAVRKKHEEEAYRGRYMQSFDMDAWIHGGQASQALSIANLTETVAEYSPMAASHQVKAWSPSPWKNAKPMEGVHLKQAAEQLCSGKGAILFLEDPVAIAQDLSALLTHRLNTHFAQNQAFSRGIALHSALTGLAQAIKAQFARDIIEQDNIVERWPATVGNRTVAGVPMPSANPMQESEATKRNNIQTFDARVERRWADYEKYIDRNKENAFLDEFNAAVNAFNQSVISPMTEMYLACLQGDSLISYFMHQFDSRDISSGAFYTQSVSDCVAGMQDQTPVSVWFENQLVASAFSPENYMLQALVFNNDALANKIKEKVQQASAYQDVPWYKLMDAIKDVMDENKSAHAFLTERYVSHISSAFVRALQNMASSAPMIGIAAMVAGSGFGLKTITLTGKRKYFLRATLREIARMTDINGRVSQDKLRHHLDIEMRRLEIDGIALDGTREHKFVVLIDKEEAKRISALPPAERVKAAAKVIRSVEEVTDNAFSPLFRHRTASLRGSSVQRIVDTAGGSMPFAGCMASIIFQGMALREAAGEKELMTLEKGTRFLGNVMGAFGASLELAERTLNDLKVLRLKAAIRIGYGASVLKKVTGFIKIGIKTCSYAALVGVFWDSVNAFDFLEKELYGMMVASLTSAAGGLLLSGVVKALVLGPIGIAWALILVFGSAIYMAIKGADDIQKWLSQFLWRNVPEGLYSLPAIYATSEMEINAFNDAVTPESN